MDEGEIKKFKKNKKKKKIEGGVDGGGMWKQGCKGYHTQR